MTIKRLLSRPIPSAASIIASKRLMVDSVSIFGKLDSEWPHQFSPPGAALAGNQLLFTGEQFSPKNPVGC